jgi:hypothetical protein
VAIIVTGYESKKIRPLTQPFACGMHLIRVKATSMNKTLIFSAVISASLMILTACNKEEAAATPEKAPGIKGILFYNESLHLSDTVVTRGQTLTAGFADSTRVEEWLVEPNDGVKVLAQVRAAEILFTQPGVYTVTAKATNGAVYTQSLQVTNSPYVQPVFSPPSGLAPDDTITLEPLAFKDDVLVFYARAKKTYSCWPLLVYQNNTTSTAVRIDFLGTPNMAAINCMPGPYPAPHSFVYTRGYANGTHTVTIRLGQPLTTYTGTVTITDDKYTFSWPDNIPVVIAPQQISRVK